jgi:hypothetical protein
MRRSNGRELSRVCSIEFFRRPTHSLMNHNVSFDSLESQNTPIQRRAPVRRRLAWKTASTPGSARSSNGGFSWYAFSLPLNSPFTG